MNKNILFFVLGILVFSSCSSDNSEIIDEEKKEKVSFTVSSPQQTRAYWSQNAIYWNTGDEVMVYATNHTMGDKFTVTNYLENQDRLAFEGETYVTSLQHAHRYFVVYPYSKALEFDGSDKVKIEIPSSQSAEVGSFDRYACVQVGKTGNFKMTVDLDNVCAFLKIEVTAACSYVKITANGYGVGGTAWVGSDGKINSDDWVQKYQEVTLSNLPQAGTYLIAIAPSSLYPVLKVEVKYPDCEAKTREATDVPITKGYVYDLGRCGKPVN